LAATGTDELSFDRTSCLTAQDAAQSQASGCPVTAARAALQPLLRQRGAAPGGGDAAATAIVGPSHPLAWALDMLFLATRGIEAATLRFALRYGALCSFPNPLSWRYDSSATAASAPTDQHTAARSPPPPRWTFLASPELLEHVCATCASNYLARFLPDAYDYATDGRGVLGSSGARNRTARRLCGAPFAPGARSAAAFADAAVSAAQRLGDVWAANAAAQQAYVVDAADHAQRLTLDVIGSVAFSHDFRQVERLQSQQQQQSSAGGGDDALLRHVNAAQAAMGALFITPLPVLRMLSALRLPPVAGLDSALAGMRHEVAPIIAKRRAELMARLGGHADAQSAAVAAVDLLDVLLLAQSKEALSDEDIWEDVHDILGAGHETTATALAAVLHALAADPSLADELDAHLAALGDRRLTASDVADGTLWYAAALVKEALRLYPPIPLFPRVAAAADVLPGGHVIAPGEVVFMSAYAMGRLPAIWARETGGDGADDDVLRFDPLRFTPAAEAARHRFAYVPFGAGPRACLGAGFALTSATLMLATLAQRFRFSLHGERAQARRGQLLQAEYDITLHFPGGVPLRVEPKMAARQAAAVVMMSSSAIGGGVR
jgi:cytochrome P450